MPVWLSGSWPLPIDFGLVKRLWISWFLRLRFCGRSRYLLEFPYLGATEFLNRCCGYRIINIYGCGRGRELEKSTLLACWMRHLRNNRWSKYQCNNAFYWGESLNFLANFAPIPGFPFLAISTVNSTHLKHWTAIWILAWIRFHPLPTADSTSQLLGSVWPKYKVTSTWLDRIDMSCAHAQWIGSLAIVGLWSFIVENQATELLISS